VKEKVVAYLRDHLGLRSSERMEGFGAWLDASLENISENGDIVLKFEVRDEMLNPLGTLHGGVFSAMMDEAMGMQLYISSEEGVAYFAMNLTTDFVKNVKRNDFLLVKPIIVRIGRNTATLRCEVYNSKNELVGQGSSNFYKIQMQ
jgi:acyl-coenzyme A thioesterase 13